MKEENEKTNKWDNKQKNNKVRRDEWNISERNEKESLKCKELNGYCKNEKSLIRKGKKWDKKKFRESE